MSVLDVIARCQCDRCGDLMRVEVDTAGTVAGWSVFDHVEDAVRGGNAGAGITSVQDEMMLCPQCTREVDAEGDKE